jgi:2-phospho-L-lactate guanylyltransferase
MSRETSRETSRQRTGTRAAIVPIKSLSAGKSRLEGALDRARLEQLCLAMMADVVSALLDCGVIDRVVVATPDGAAAEAARALGAEAFLGPDPGLNAAIERATQRLASEGAMLVMTVLGDVAAAEPADFRRLVEGVTDLADETNGTAVGLAPAADGGTAALVRQPPDAIEARFGADSAARHRAECKRHDVPLRELDLASLRLDLDRVADVDAFLESGRSGSRTRAALDDMGWRRLAPGRPSV